MSIDKLKAGQNVVNYLDYLAMMLDQIYRWSIIDAQWPLAKTNRTVTWAGTLPQEILVGIVHTDCDTANTINIKQAGSDGEPTGDAFDIIAFMAASWASFIPALKAGDMVMYQKIGTDWYAINVPPLPLFMLDD